MKKLEQEYKNKSAIAALSLTNLMSLCIFDVHYEYGESYVVVGICTENKVANLKKHKIRLSKSLDQFFRRGNSTYYINEFIRI